MSVGHIRSGLKANAAPLQFRFCSVMGWMPSPHRLILRKETKASLYGNMDQRVVSNACAVLSKTEN